MPSIPFEARKTHCLAKAIWTATPTQWGHAQRFWLCAKEENSIISFLSENRGDGYWRCAYMMIDKDLSYASPSTVYRVLNEAGMLQKKANDTQPVVKVLKNL